MITKTNINLIFIYLMCLLTLGWITIFFYLFFFVPNITQFSWARGEIGDFIGGGLGGLAVFLLIFTSWIQVRQLSNQEKDLKEASVFRTFEALKPEVENISVRIVSKIIKAKLVDDTEIEFDEMLKKFRNGDRTVFLRAINDKKYKEIISKKIHNIEVKESCERFRNLISVVYNEIKDKPNEDFSKAIRSTEVFQVYEKIYEN